MKTSKNRHDGGGDRAEAKDHRAKPVFGAGPAVQEATARGHEVPPMKGVYRGV